MEAKSLSETLVIFYHITRRLIQEYHILHNHRYETKNQDFEVGELKENYFLGCDAIQFGRNLPAIQKSVLPPSSGQSTRCLLGSHFSADRSIV
jgi:hypothetical protein